MPLAARDWVGMQGAGDAAGGLELCHFTAQGLHQFPQIADGAARFSQGFTGLLHRLSNDGTRLFRAVMGLMGVGSFKLRIRPASADAQENPAEFTPALELAWAKWSQLPPA